MLIHLGNAAAGIHSTAELAGTLGDGSLNGRITTAGGSAFGQETLGILRRLLLQPAVAAVAGEPGDKHAFVYGSLLSGLHNHRVLGTAELVGKARTVPAHHHRRCCHCM